MAATLGWPYPFRVAPWKDLEAKYADLRASDRAYESLHAIVVSVRASRLETELIAFTSMHDLMVRAAPAPDPPYDLVAVRVTPEHKRDRDGDVVIEHLSTNGRNDRVARPQSEAVPLFWRFMIEKFGIHPRHVEISRP